MAKTGECVSLECVSALNESTKMQASVRPWSPATHTKKRRFSVEAMFFNGKDTHIERKNLRENS